MAQGGWGGEEVGMGRGEGVYVSLGCSCDTRQQGRLPKICEGRAPLLVMDNRDAKRGRRAHQHRLPLSRRRVLRDVRQRLQPVEVAAAVDGGVKGLDAAVHAQQGDAGDEVGAAAGRGGRWRGAAAARPCLRPATRADHVVRLCAG